MKKTFLKMLVALCVPAFAIGMAACDKHEHTYDSEWTRTSTEHYYAATCEHTGETKDRGPHKLLPTEARKSALLAATRRKLPPIHVTTNTKKAVAFPPPAKRKALSNIPVSTVKTVTAIEALCPRRVININTQ